MGFRLGLERDIVRRRCAFDCPFERVLDIRQDFERGVEMWFGTSNPGRLYPSGFVCASGRDVERQVTLRPSIVIDRERLDVGAVDKVRRAGQTY